jgi:plastocyanin
MTPCDFAERGPVPLLLGACGGSGKPSPAAPPPPNAVRVENFAFSPDTITVHVGATVTWLIHEPGAPHNVVSLSGVESFNSGAPVGSGRFAYTFRQPGTTTYQCLVHPSMRGTVVVTP